MQYIQYGNGGTRATVVPELHGREAHMWHSNFPLDRKHLPCGAALLPHWQPELKQSPAWSGLITHTRSILSITSIKKSNLEDDCNPRCICRGKMLASPTIILNPSVPRLKAASQLETHRWLWLGWNCRFHRPRQWRRRAGSSGIRRRKSNSWSSMCAAAVTHLGVVCVEYLRSGP